jgi:hypothetical protein
MKTTLLFAAVIAVSSCSPCSLGDGCGPIIHGTGGGSGGGSGSGGGAQGLSGSAQLAGPSAFPAFSAMYLVAQHGTVIDTGNVVITLKEASERCVADGVVDTLSPDAGSQRALSISLRSAAAPVAVGHYVQSAGSMALAVDLEPPGGNGAIRNAVSAEVEVTESTGQVISGTLTATFPGDSTPTTASFTAVRCGVFVML